MRYGASPIQLQQKLPTFNLATEGAFLEHPQDVLAAALALHEAGLEVALVVLVKTMGGAVRAPGALMAVSHTGDVAGYLSGGCIDADVIVHAQNTLQTDQSKKLKYGAGSPYFDLPLPCGGSLDLVILPRPDMKVLRQAHDQLASRQMVSLGIGESGFVTLASDGDQADFKVSYIPKLKLRIAGRGADCIALLRATRSAGFEVCFQSPKEIELSIARRLQVNQIDHLKSPCNLPCPSDDEYTAFVLMFHDVEWESVLLKQALSGHAFYIGAVGSARTHGRRCEELGKLGCAQEEIRRISGPIGLIPSLRDASLLATSVLAEIIASFQADKAALAS